MKTGYSCSQFHLTGIFGTFFVYSLLKIPDFNLTRIDDTGALQHVVIRGIERKATFEDDMDGEGFIERLSSLLQETITPCYAWTFITNHVHLLLHMGTVPIISIMHRLLAGYALRFNPALSGTSAGTDIFFSIATNRFFMRMQSAGIDLSAVIAAACRYLGIEEKKLPRPTIRVEIARARALISYFASQNLSISGSEVARRFKVDRSAIRRTTQRLSQDPELPAATKTVQRELEID